MGSTVLVIMTHHVLKTDCKHDTESLIQY